MSCEPYNLIKDGDFRSLVGENTVYVGFDSIAALYDGDLTTTVLTISGSPSGVQLEAEFGEAYDLCHLNYYTSELDVNNIQVTYGIDAGTENTSLVSLVSSGTYRAPINTFARFVRLTHTVSGTGADIREVEIIGEENDTLGFGGSKAEETDFFLAPHATVGTLSAATNVIPLFNDNHFDQTAKIAVAPTFTLADDYIHISTTSSGTFYGIDGFGFQQPGPKHMPLTDDDFLSNSLNPQWERVLSGQAHLIIPTKGALSLDLAYQESPSIASARQTTGIISKEFFTAQSFTAEVEIRFLNITNVTSFDSQGRDFFMCLTNSFAIPDVGFKDAYMSDDRRGGSIGGIAMRVVGINNTDPSLDTFTTVLRAIDGNSDNRPSVDDTDSRWTGGNGGGFGGVQGSGQVLEIFGPTLSNIEDLINEGNSLGDFTAVAAWHKWRLTYDNQKKEMSAYIDNIFIGSYVFRVEAFDEACKLFIGFHGNGGVKWEIRNFKIFKDKLYKQKNVALTINGGTATATISGAEAPKAIDGSTSTAYVGPGPNAISHFRVDFDSPKDIVSYRLKQRDQSTGTAAFGKTYFPDVARTALADFGGQTTYIHSYPNTSSFVLRSPLFTNTSVTVSGITYLDLQFVTYDLTAQTNNALVIEELEIIEEVFVDVLVQPAAEDARKIPWLEGRWRNLRSYGSTKSLALKDKISPETTYRPFPEYIVQGVDYDVSSAVNGRQFSSKADDYHHSETIFSSTGTTAGGAYTQWHSDVQEDRLFWIWRSFDEKSRIKAVYWDSSTLRPSNVADKFKFQYLKDGGNPQLEGDWINIPPIVVPHPHTDTTDDSNYKDYRDYLIANNDGEFYTDYFLLPDFGTGFTLGDGAKTPKGLVVPKGYGISTSITFGADANPSSNGLKGYLEFDFEIFTTAIRMWIKDPLESGRESGLPGLSSIPGEERSDFALESLRVYRSHGAGSYLSPVFDTGTPQNTERLRAAVALVEGSSASIQVRSAAEAPEQSYNSRYETWENLGTPGNTQISFPSILTTSRGINNAGQMILHVGSQARLYDPALDTWNLFEGYPSSAEVGESNFEDDGLAGNNATTRPGVLPDDSVTENVTILDDGHMYVAAYDIGPVRNPRILRYIFSGDLAGWSVLPNNRPPFSEFAVMAGIGSRIYFFDRNGVTSYYDVTLDNWVLLDVDFPIFGGQRTSVSSVVYNGKVYLFGGEVSSAGRTEGSIFDPLTETFSDIAPSPHTMRGHQAVLVPEEKVIYVLPVASQHYTAMKYFIEEDRWQVLESMMNARNTGSGVFNSGALFHYFNNYIYNFGSGEEFTRSLVSRPLWSQGKQPDFRDPVWGNAPSTVVGPWKEIGAFGELMPQERYFQYRVELYSDDRKNSSVLESINVVTPQEILVPASGTANAFVKIGVSSDETYQSWYTGEQIGGGFGSDFSILYTQSEDGVAWGFPATASGTYNSGVNFAVAMRSPWVVKNSVVDYQFWYGRDHAGSGAFDTPVDIWYVTSSEPSNMSGTYIAQEVISAGVIAQTSTGVLQPCVIKNSPTSYDMFYTGVDSSVSRIFHTISSDGIVWSSHALSLDKGQDTVNNYDAQSVFRPMVLKENGVFRMWYTGTGSDGLNRILYTQSTDAITWEVPRLIININSQGELDNKGASKPFVILDEVTYYMYYFGFDGTNTHLIRATSLDGFDWSNFILIFPSHGIQGILDNNGVIDFFTLINRVSVIPGDIITTGQIKIHN